MISTIVVAAGSGMRMGGEVPKQFLKIKGTPILMRVIENFGYLNGEIIVILNPDWIEYWRDLCHEFSFTVPHKVIRGGSERYESVAAGLAAVSPLAELILVQDGVRPFASRHLTNRVVDGARLHGSVVPAIGLVDTLRTRKGRMVDRNDLLSMQTPQGFVASVLKNAYQNQSYQPHFTDDASVVQAAGAEITFVEGERENIKITTPFDIKIAEILW